MTLTAAATTPVCAECHRPPGPGQSLSRRRCSTCYDRHHRRGTHIDLPRPSRSRADVVDDYLLLRTQGHSRTQIAARLGMTIDALNAALKRAALAGDTRIDYRPRRTA